MFATLTVNSIADSTSVSLWKKISSAIDGTSDLLILLFLLILLCSLLVAGILLVFYFIESSKKRDVSERDKWYKIPPTEFGVYNLLIRCHQVYRKHCNNPRLSEEFRDSMFDEALESKWYSKSTKHRVKRMLSIDELVNKYLSLSSFGPQEFYSFCKNYQEFHGHKTSDCSAKESIAKAIEGTKLNDNQKAIEALFNLYAEGYLDENCQMTDKLSKSGYYALAKEVCDFAGVRCYDSIFAKIWYKNDDPITAASRIKSGKSSLKGASFSDQTDIVTTIREIIRQ